MRRMRLRNLQKDNITLNAVLPGIVSTGAVPQASIDATKPEQYVLGRVVRHKANETALPLRRLS